MKRVVTVQDLSCLGRCSLTVALPVISAMGVECAVIPTALLSTHTGLPGNTCLDLWGQAASIVDHWKTLNLEFDGVYTGYLATAGQCRELTGLVNRLRGPETLVFTDPAMGDNGRLYRGLSPELPEAMAALCARADVIAPNVTEACLLTGRPWHPEPDDGQCRDLLAALLDLGCGAAMLTGVRRGGEIGVLGRSRAGADFALFREYLPLSCHGTGDLFSACCVGALMNGQTIAEAASLAMEFVARAIAATDPARKRFGVPFEPLLRSLPELLKANGCGLTQ